MDSFEGDSVELSAAELQAYYSADGDVVSPIRVAQPAPGTRSPTVSQRALPSRHRGFVTTSTTSNPASDAEAGLGRGPGRVAASATTSTAAPGTDAPLDGSSSYEPGDVPRPSAAAPVAHVNPEDLPAGIHDRARFSQHVRVDPNAPPAPVAAADDDSAARQTRRRQYPASTPATTSVPGPEGPWSQHAAEQHRDDSTSDARHHRIAHDHDDHVHFADDGVVDDHGHHGHQFQSSSDPHHAGGARQPPESFTASAPPVDEMGLTPRSSHEARVAQLMSDLDHERSQSTKLRQQLEDATRRADTASAAAIAAVAQARQQQQEAVTSAKSEGSSADSSARAAALERRVRELEETLAHERDEHKAVLHRAIEAATGELATTTAKLRLAESDAASLRAAVEAKDTDIQIAQSRAAALARALEAERADSLAVADAYRDKLAAAVSIARANTPTPSMPGVNYPRAAPPMPMVSDDGGNPIDSSYGELPRAAPPPQPASSPGRGVAVEASRHEVAEATQHFAGTAPATHDTSYSATVDARPRTPPVSSVGHDARRSPPRPAPHHPHQRPGAARPHDSLGPVADGTASTFTSRPTSSYAGGSGSVRREAPPALRTPPRSAEKDTTAPRGGDLGGDHGTPSRDKIRDKNATLPTVDPTEVEDLETRLFELSRDRDATDEQLRRVEHVRVRSIADKAKKENLTRRLSDINQAVSDVRRRLRELSALER